MTESLSESEPAVDDGGESSSSQMLELSPSDVVRVFAGLAVVAWLVSPSVSDALVLAGAWFGLPTVLFAALLEARDHVEDVGMGLPFPSDERAEVSTRGAAAGGAAATAATAASIVADQGLVGLVEKYGVGGVLYQLSLTAIGAIQSAGETFLAPIRAFAGGIADVVSAVFPARIINEAADFTAFSITQGEWSFFGPLTFAVGVVAVLLGMWVFVRAGSRINFSPLSFFFGR